MHPRRFHRRCRSIADFWAGPEHHIEQVASGGIGDFDRAGRVHFPALPGNPLDDGAAQFGGPVLGGFQVYMLAARLVADQPFEEPVGPSFWERERA